MLHKYDKLAILIALIFALSMGQQKALADETIIYPAPSSAPTTDDYRVQVNGEELTVYDTEPAAYVYFSFRGEATLSIHPKQDVKWVDIRPLSKKVKFTITDNVIQFAIDRPINLSLELNGESTRPLYIFANPPEEDKPDPDDADVIYFEGGKIHDVGFLHVSSGQTVYIEGGAIVRGAIIAKDADDISIRGRGVIDGSLWGYKKTRLMLFDHCRNVRLEGFIIVDSPGWTVVPINCDGVNIDNIKHINWRYGSDGIDLVGTSNVQIKNCFLRDNDDNIVIKSWGGTEKYPATPQQGPSIKNIRVQHCVIWNMPWGNGLEIGFELRCARVSDVLFRDIDIIHVERSAAISIHNGDNATVENIAYEDIRIEDARHKLIDFGIFLSQYSVDRHADAAERKRRYLHGAWDGVQDIAFYGKKEHAKYRGRIRNITFKNIQIVGGEIPFSILSGYDEAHAIEDVVFQNLQFYGKKITNARDGKFFIEQARNVKFE